MAQPNLIPMPWAENGQKQDPIPAEQTSAGNGRASWKTGFPIENTRPVSNGGVPANYQDFQGVLHTLSEFACYQQAGGIFTWSDELDYEVGARVLGSDNNVYVAIANNGVSSVVTDPVGDSSGKWVADPNITQASAAALEVASGFVTSGGYTINNGFTVTGGVINGQITSAQYASAIGNASTNIGATATPVYVSGGVVTPCGGVAVTSAAQTFSGEKTFTSVISGGVTGNAGTATRLQTARNIQTNLANTSAASFNGTANIAPGVTGTLAVANGGTGVTTIANIQAGKDGAGNTITSTYATKADVAEEMATKADIDGNYPDMTVGNAEQLVSEDYLTDTAPYVFRTAGGNVDIGDREYDELVGGTIAWNQLRDETGFYTGTTRGLTATLTNHVYAISGTSTENAAFNLGFTDLQAGHKYLVKGKNANTGAHVTLRVYNSNVGTILILDTESTIINITTAANYQFFFLMSDGPNIEVDLKAIPQCFDLTAMFGTAIADYIYALEQATAGAGVAWFKTHFPKDYYAYDPGSLQSVQAASHDMVGFNQLSQPLQEGSKWTNGVFDSNVTTSYAGSPAKVPCFPATTYCFALPNITAHGYVYYNEFDANGNFLRRNTGDILVNASIKYATFTTSNDTHFVGVFVYRVSPWTAAEIADANLNLSWSGYRNGEYEAYAKHSYPLDSTLTLRGIPKLDVSNNLVYDGDTYEADGTVTRRYGIVDLGTLTWVAVTGNSYANFYSQDLENLIKYDAVNAVYVCSGYVCYANNETTDPDRDNYLWVNAQKRVRIKDTAKASMTVEQFKSAMSGVYLVYELATPTTETADAFQTPQIVSDFGTEQYVDAAVAAGTRDVAIPVGHDTRYTQNLRDKLRRLPNMPDADGVYNVLYTGRQCEFIAAPAASDATPQPLGVAASGTDTDYARADHVHERPVEIDIDRKKLDNVLALLNGALSVQNTDSTEAYTKTVPAKAQPWAGVQEVGGRTVVWNQLVVNGNFESSSGWNGRLSSVSISENVATVTPTSDGDLRGIYSPFNIPSVKSHKYFMSGYIKSPITSDAYISFGGSQSGAPTKNVTAGNWENVSGIYENTQETGNSAIYFLVKNSITTAQSIQYKEITTIDLTLMFGSGNEPSTVAEFTAMFPSINPAYNAGTLKSAGVTGAVSESQNLITFEGRTLGTVADGNWTVARQWDTNKFYLGVASTYVFSSAITDYSIDDDVVSCTTSSAGYGIGVPVKLDKGQTYTITVTSDGEYNCQVVVFVDADGKKISDTYFNSENASKTFTVPNDAALAIVVYRVGARIGESNLILHNGKVMLQRGSVATPYTKGRLPVTLPIPSAVQNLPGYGHSAGVVYNYIDWQRKVYVQRVGSVDLGTLPWSYSSQYSRHTVKLPLAKTPANNYVVANIICPLYMAVGSNYTAETSGYNMTMGINSGTPMLCIRNESYTDPTTFKTAMNGVMLYYELETPVETDISDLLSEDNLLAVEPGGTVSFPSQLGDDYRLPVPSDVEYTIDMAPDTPSTDGTYTLQCVVSDGVATYSWVTA